MKNYSVLMAVYYKEDKEAFKNALESIFNQSFQTNDFVLVCDGPLTNDLNSVISEFLDCHKSTFRVIRLPENKGLGNALFWGLRLCKNQYIMRADSDDISLPNRAKKQVQFIDDGGFDLVSTNLLLFSGSEKNIVGRRNVPVSRKEIIRFSKTRSPFNHPSVMFRKKAVISAGNYLDLPFKEDYYLWIRMILNGASVSNMEEPLVLMRESGVVSRRKNKKAFRSMVFLLKYMRNHRYISFPRYCLNILIYGIQQIIPDRALSRIYHFVLHKK